MNARSPTLPSENCVQLKSILVLLDFSAGDAAALQRTGQPAQRRRLFLVAGSNVRYERDHILIGSRTGDAVRDSWISSAAVC
jgi:hypothetical protein